MRCTRSTEYRRYEGTAGTPRGTSAWTASVPLVVNLAPVGLLASFDQIDSFTWLIMRLLTTV